MRTIVQQIASPGQKAVSVKAIREGIHFIVNQPIILSTMLIDFFATFFSAASTLMPIVVRDVLKVGAVVASLVVSQIREIRKQGLIFLGAVMLFGLATISFGLARSLTAAILALILWCLGFC